MKEAVFETATLADAVAKAHRIAPTGGREFDLAQGIVIEVDPSTPDKVIMKSTDLFVACRQEVGVVSMGDEPATWRVNARLFNGIASTLPMHLGSQVRVFDKGDGSLQFRCDKVKAKLRQVLGDYPPIERYEPGDLGSVPNFAQRLKQVAWATDKRGILSGVHLDGKNLYATNTYVLAMVPCDMPLDAPITAPLSLVSSLIKNTSEVQMRATDAHIQVMPDSWTQTSSVIFSDPYPNVKWAIDAFSGEHTLMVNVETLVESIERMLVLVKSERIPRTTLTFKTDALELEMDAPDVGKIADEFEASGGDDDPLTIKFNPEWLRSAVQASGQPTVWIDYTSSKPFQPIRVRDDNGYVAVMMPIRDTAQAAA